MRIERGGGKRGRERGRWNRKVRKKQKREEEGLCEKKRGVKEGVGGWVRKKYLGWFPPFSEKVYHFLLIAFRLFQDLMQNTTWRKRPLALQTSILFKILQVRQLHSDWNIRIWRQYLGDHQQTTVFTVQLSFLEWHGTNRMSWSIAIIS